MTTVYTPLKPQTSERETVIEWLKSHGYPALPVAPAQDAFKYPKRNKQGEIEHEKDGVTPKPLFTGKNPSYLDQSGVPRLVNHRQYQKCLPSDRELKEWFANPANGVGTLGGWNNTVWLDFDVKQFPSQQECDAAVLKFLERNELQQTFIERSHSGGWRVGIRVKEKPEFTNFALSLGAKHIGEALGEGRFTVLAPTIGVSGNPYQSINRVMPVEVADLESIGIYPTSTKKPMSEVRVTPQSIAAYIPGSIPLEQLGTDTSREILQGGCPTGDRSEALTTAVQEWYGWQNWTGENGIAVTGTPEDLAHYAGQQLGIDSDRVERILKTIDIVSSDPAALHRGGEENCWKKIRRLDKATFEAKCPAHIKDDIKRAYQPSDNAPQQKLSLRDAVEKAEQILKAQISSQLDPIEASIFLEELRRDAGVNEYNWERKYLKPIREKLERSLVLPDATSQPAQINPDERLRLDLLALTKESDPIKKVRKRAEIASHYGISKGEIEFLCRTLDADSKISKAQFYALDDFLNMESDGIDYLIPGLLPRGETVLCAGLPKSGKTLLAIDAGFAIATGETHFLGEQVSQGKVLLISVDESAQSTKAKLIKRGFRARDAGSLAVMTAWDIGQLDVLEAKLEDFRPDLVIIDSLKRITAGREISENSAEFADVLYTLKELMGRYGAASILIHHSNKNSEATGVSRVRGSTAIAGAVWGIWQMDIPEAEDDSEGKPSKGKKQKRFDPTNPNRIFTAICRDTEGALLNIRFNPENHSYSISEGDQGAQSERKTQEQTILDILAQVAPNGLTGREVMEYSGLGRGVYSVLNRMVDKRLITHRQSKTDSRMTVYCLPKSKGTPPPSHSYPDCDQYSPHPITGKGLEIDHKLITTTGIVDHNLEGDRTHAINPNPQPVHHPVEIDHKNTNKRGGGVSPNSGASSNTGLITSEQYSDTPAMEQEKYAVTNVDADGWGEVVRMPAGETVAEEAIAPTPQSSQDDPIVGAVVEEEPDYDQFPHKNTRATWGVRKDRAQRIKQQILAIANAKDYFALADNSEYTKDEKEWVRRNLLTKEEKSHLTEVVKTKSLVEYEF